MLYFYFLFFFVNLSKLISTTRVALLIFHFCLLSIAVDIKESNFRYKPSVYLHDIELKEALKKITTAEEMEEFLKARYKTKKEERPHSKRKLNRITSNNSRSTARSTIEKAPAVIVPRTIEEEERVPSNQQQQEQPAGDVGAGPSKDSYLFRNANFGKKKSLTLMEVNSLFEGKTDQQQLSIAVHLGLEEVIKKLISGGTVDINAPDPEYDGKAPLMLAAVNGSIASLELLLDATVDVNKAHAETGETALMIASQQPNGVHFIKKLFESADSKNLYVKIDAGDKNKQTALMHAAIKGRYNNVCYLLEEGADLNASDINGRTALMHSVMQGSDKNVDILLQKKAVINGRDCDGRTALILAATQGTLKNVQALIAYSKDSEGILITASDKNDWTALTHAATEGHTEIVRTLIEHHPFCDSPCKLLNGVENALEKAKKNGDKALVLSLRKGLKILKEKIEQIANERSLERSAAARCWEDVDDYMNTRMRKFTEKEVDERRKHERELDKSKRPLQGGKCGESIPITVDSPDLKNDPELLEIVHKATMDGNLLETTEIYTLLNSSEQLPISTCPPYMPAAGSLFLYDKAATPHYKRDEHNFGKESHNKLVIDKIPRIKVYYGTKKDPPLQRRSYFLNSYKPLWRDDAIRPQELVVVHYLVPQVSSLKGKLQKLTEAYGSEDQVVSGSFDEIDANPLLYKINEEEDRPSPHKRRKLADEPLKMVQEDRTLHSLPPLSSLSPQSENDISATMRSLIGIGVRLQIPELDLEAICDDVNDLCDKPPAGCEAASNSGSINYHSLDRAAQELLNVKFDFIEAEMEREWKKAVANHKAAGLIKKLCNIVVEHFSVVSSDVRKALESAVLDEKASMATALRKLGKIDSIPKKELMQLVGSVIASPLEWARDHFKVIRDAVLDEDIEFAKALIHSALENKPEKFMFKS
jgi:ankyrin repeat protein